MEMYIEFEGGPHGPFEEHLAIVCSGRHLGGGTFMMKPFPRDIQLGYAKKATKRARLDLRIVRRLAKKYNLKGFKVSID